jgi:hypothetical protein
MASQLRVATAGSEGYASGCHDSSKVRASRISIRLRWTAWIG